jgi:hypothetical protein
MMNKDIRDVSISVMAIAIIVFGIRYHLMRQRLRHTELHAWYQRDNAELFDGKLPDARVEWSDLTADNDAGKTYQLEDDSFVILLDRNENTSESEAGDTLKHEACHIASWGEELGHGPKWQECMSKRMN